MKACHPAPAPRPTPHKPPFPMAAAGTMRGGGPSQEPAEGATHLYMPDATASPLGLQAWQGVHMAPSFPYPWKEINPSGDPLSYAGGPRELEEPQPITERPCPIP